MFELTITAPGKNALSRASMTVLIEGLRAARGEPLLLFGAGDAFSAGLNLKEVASLDVAGMRDFLHTLDDLVDALYTYPGPTVAWVNGHAIAGGCVLALACDAAVATDDAAVRIGLNETAIGLPFPPKILAMVRATVPPASLDEVVLGAELHAPRVAMALGLVNEVASDARARALVVLEGLARHPKETYAHTKRELRRGVLDLSPERRREYDEKVLPAWASPEIKARLQSRLARR